MKEALKPFETDIKDWTKVAPESAKLMISQSELLLKESIETAKTITAKAEKLLSIQVTAGTALAVYFFNNINTAPVYLLLTSLFCTGTILISAFYSCRAYFKYEIAVTGGSPFVYTRTKFIDNDFTPDLQYINMALNVLENTQNKININAVSNKKRTKLISRSMYFLIAVICCPLLSYLFLFLFPGLHFAPPL